MQLDVQSTEAQKAESFSFQASAWCAVYFFLCLLRELTLFSFTPSQCPMMNDSRRLTTLLGRWDRFGKRTGRSLLFQAFLFICSAVSFLVIAGCWCGLVPLSELPFESKGHCPPRTFSYSVSCPAWMFLWVEMQVQPLKLLLWILLLTGSLPNWSLVYFKLTVLSKVINFSWAISLTTTTSLLLFVHCSLLWIVSERSRLSF